MRAYELGVGPARDLDNHVEDLSKCRRWIRIHGDRVLCCLARTVLSSLAKSGTSWKGEITLLSFSRNKRYSAGRLRVSTGNLSPG